MNKKNYIKKFLSFNKKVKGKKKHPYSRSQVAF